MTKVSKEMLEKLEEEFALSDLDAEATVLAGIMADGSIATVASTLLPTDFYSTAHAKIYEAAQAVHCKGKPVTAESVAHALRETGQLDSAGGANYLAEIVGTVPHPRNVGGSARRVMHLSFDRQQAAVEKGLLGL